MENGEEEDRLSEMDEVGLGHGDRSLNLRIEFRSMQNPLAAFSVEHAFDGSMPCVTQCCSEGAARQMALDILTEFFERELRKPRTFLEGFACGRMGGTKRD